MTVNMTNSERYLRTKSIYLAAYILAKSGELAGIGVSLDGVVFSFVRSPEYELLAKEFNTDTEAMIDARLYAGALQMLSRERQEQLMKFHAGENQP